MHNSDICRTKAGNRFGNKLVEHWRRSLS